MLPPSPSTTGRTRRRHPACWRSWRQTKPRRSSASSGSTSSAPRRGAADCCRRPYPVQPQHVPHARNRRLVCGAPACRHGGNVGRDPGSCRRRTRAVLPGPLRFLGAERPGGQRSCADAAPRRHLRDLRLGDAGCRRARRASGDTAAGKPRWDRPCCTTAQQQVPPPPTGAARWRHSLGCSLSFGPKAGNSDKPARSPARPPSDRSGRLPPRGADSRRLARSRGSPRGSA